MKRKKILLWLILSFFKVMVFAQTQTPVYLSQSITNGNSRGFYRYLPGDYSTTTKNYPLIIWVHGAGQVGQGNVADLPKVLEWGVPKIINEGGFPASFTAGDSSYSFIIISPQFMGWPSGANISGILTYAMNNYRVNPDRVYLMGISAGGGAVWENASASLANSNKLAAIIPFCGTLSPTQTLANRIASSNLPVWAFHNTNDGTVPVAYSRNWKNFINGYVPAPNPLTILTEFPVVSNNAVIAHECWSLATLPTYKPNGINIYEWLLGYKKRTVTINAVPLASAGQDQGVVLPANILLNASASNDPDGIIVSYKWKKLAGPSSYIFSDSTIVNPIVSNVVQGVYQFELAVTDNLGATSRDTLFVNVYASIPTGAQQRILIDVGGTITASPNLNGNVWNNMTDARPGIRISNALTIINQLSGISVEVINRVDGNYSTGSNGLGTGNTAGIVGDYPASGTTDHALIHSSATNGKWRIKGLQPDKIYTVKFWGTRSNTTAARNAEIKRADDNVWKTYSATGNTNYNNAAQFNITGKTEMDFDIRTKAGSDFSTINIIDIYYGSDTTQNPPPPTINLLPVARAGADTTLQLPVDSVILRGCASSDPENAVLKYKWRKIAGPTAYQMPVDTLCSIKVKGLVAGSYSFELSVTDTAGLTGKDSVVVTVKSLITTTWPPQVTPICNRPYKLVVVGSSTAFGTGANPIDSSWVQKFRQYLLLQNQQIQVINIATLGLTSYDVSPTGSVVPYPFTVDTLRNITKALSLNPDAIILNLPSNDVAREIPTNVIHQNYNMITAAAESRNVPIWITSTQPRDGLSPAEKILQMDLRDWIYSTYGNKSVDFWSTVANADGTINSLYSAGDGVHLNNYGHHVIFTRIIEEKIWDTICIRNNITPVAIAGNDTTITGNIAVFTLNGLSSYDPDGTIINYNWRIINSSTATLTAANTATPVFSSNISGNHIVELKVTDNLGRQAFDTVSIISYLPNIAPVANAGIDIVQSQITDSIRLNADASLDIDGSIIKFKWQKIDGPIVTIVNDSVSRPWIKDFEPGTYNFKLTVTDDSLAIDSDTVNIIINAIPEANAGADQLITLPNNIISLNANGSIDNDGSIAVYRWKKIAGAGTAIIVDTTAIATYVNILSAGMYEFELTITDNLGAQDKDTVKITVNPDPNNPPIANAGTDQTITLPNNNLSLNGSLSSDIDGSISAYKWRKITDANGVSISDSSASITNVTFVNSGQYLFELTVTDDLGSSTKDTTMITVYPAPVNLNPVANAGTDKNIQLPINRVLLDGRNSFDPEGSLITFAWSLISGPAGSQLLTSVKDTTSVTFINSGSYIFRLTVTDITGLTGTDDILINVLATSVISKKIKVNVFGGSNPYTNPQWNNWNLNAGLNSSKFLYEDAGLSNLSASITAAGLISDNGANYASGATVCPPPVLRYNSANTSIRTLTINGCTPAKKYNLEFYASRSNTGNSTVFQVGNLLDTISTSSNSNDYARFQNITADVNGRITISISRIGTWNYLAGFMISEQEDSQPLISFRGPTVLNSTYEEENFSVPKETKAASISIYPNPVRENLNLIFTEKFTGKYSLALLDINGKTVLQKTGIRYAGSNTTVIDIKALKKGIYILQFITPEKKSNSKIIKL